MPGMPTTSSSSPSPSRSPAASAAPNRSVSLSLPSRVTSSVPADSSPWAVPYSRWTMPLPSAPSGTGVPANSSDAPIARSAQPSPLKSPQTTADPNESPRSGVSATPAVPWESTVVFDVPWNRVTVPARVWPSTVSYGAATARPGVPHARARAGGVAAWAGEAWTAETITRVAVASRLDAREALILRIVPLDPDIRPTAA